MSHRPGMQRITIKLVHQADTLVQRGFIMRVFRRESQGFDTNRAQKPNGTSIHNHWLQSDDLHTKDTRDDLDILLTTQDERFTFARLRASLCFNERPAV